MGPCFTRHYSFKIQPGCPVNTEALVLLWVLRGASRTPPDPIPLPSLGLEDPLEEENGNSLQYSCLKNSMDRGAWWATTHEVAKSQTQLK